MAQVDDRNTILENLDLDDRRLIIAAMSDFDFESGYVFCEPGEEIRYISFVDAGLVSAVAIMTNGETVEAYMVGREGFVGVTGWLVPFRSSVRCIGQVAGSARRIEARRLREIAGERAGVRLALGNYAASLQVELEQSAACNAIHKAEQRLAKWLLRAHDRTSSDTLFMTQEFLGNMLGTQRTTVTESAQSLAALGAISYSRGRVLIRDRGVLEKVVCECYAAAKAVSDHPRT